MDFNVSKCVWYVLRYWLHEWGNGMVCQTAALGSAGGEASERNSEFVEENLLYRVSYFSYWARIEVFLKRNTRSFPQLGLNKLWVFTYTSFWIRALNGKQADVFLPSLLHFLWIGWGNISTSAKARNRWVTRILVTFWLITSIKQTMIFL